jgi:hypothetical protein
MPEWVFIGYLILSFVSLVTAFFVVQWRSNGKRSPVYDCLMMGAVAVACAVVMMVPLFYMVYIGLLANGRDAIVPNLLLPLVWAHWAVYAWGTGKTFWEQHAIGMAFFLTVPVLFLGVWVGAMVRFRYSIVLIDWVLLLISLALWLKARVTVRKSGSRE